MISPYAQVTLQPPLFSDGGRYQNWGNVGNRGWDSRPGLNGLGYIVPDIVGPLGGALPTLQGFGAEVTPGLVALGIIGIGVAIAGPAIGAYQGSKKSNAWAAGGAVLGIVAAGLTNAIMGAIVNASVKV